MTDRLHLPQRYRRILEALLHEYVPDAEVWAYGSHVTGESHDGSDLDLVVRGSELKPLGDGFFGLVEAIEKSNIPILVRGRDWARLPESFHQEIERKYTVLQEGAKDTTRGEWREVAIGDLVEIKHGFAFKGTSIRDEPNGDILLTPGNFGISGGFKRDKFKYFDGPVPEEYVLQEGDLLVTMTDLSKQSDTLGYPALVPPRTQGRRYLHNQRLGKISTKAPGEICARYIYYVMCSEEYRHEVLASATGTTVKHTSPDRIKRFRFSLPTLSEQRAIAHILGTLDDKIELNRRVNETLEEMARALFKSWFVDFDPVRAKAALTTPLSEASDWTVERACAYLNRMDENIADLFPDRLVESELGEIPEGWEVKRLAECFKLTMGQSPPGSTYNEIGKGLPFFQGNADFSFRYPERRRYCTHPTRIAYADDTMVSVRAPVGAINMAWEECCIGRGVAALRHISGSASFTFYTAWALQNEIQLYEHTGTVFGAINKKQFESLRVFQPTAKLIEVFETRIRSIDERIRSNDSNSRNLSYQRDALLPKLVSGNVRIK